jgi:ornithine decarboxylase
MKVKPTPMHTESRFFEVTERLQTPFIIFDLERIQQHYNEMSQAFPNVRIHYAVKCNSEDRIIRFLNQLGASFEIASQNEAAQLIRLNIPSHKLICMHPIKSPEFLSYLHEHEITILAVDSCEEVDKIAQYAPNSKLVVRIHVDNEGSLWNLNGKFGLNVDEVPSIFQHIRDHNLILYGLTFQVGSQCENVSTWLHALRICESVWQDASKYGYELKFLSLGGGLPAQYTRQVPSIAEIGALVMQELQTKLNTWGHDLQVAIEPGRSLVADAGILITKVFGIATRNSTKWAYVETGTYNGLVEAIETEERNFYPIIVKDNNRPQCVYHIGGPSCVTLDTPFEDVTLPELRLGDRLYILSAGAYTSACATSFNGFPIPAVHYWQDLIEQ